jgi:hypothetical protein
MKLWIKAAVAVTSTAALGYAFYFVQTRLLAGSQGPAYRSTKNRIALSARTPPQQAQTLDERAWSLFAQLTDAAVASPSANRFPQWEAWSTKCGLGLDRDEDCKKVNPGDGDPETASRRNLLSSLDFPAQLVPELVSLKDEKFDEVFADFARHPQFASALFNPEARDTIEAKLLAKKWKLDLMVSYLNLRGVHGADRQIASSTFPPNSMIVKTIWQVVPFDGNKPLLIYDSFAPPKTVLGNPNQMKNPVFWDSKVSIDPDLGKECPSPAAGNTLPIKCFYHYEIQPNDKEAFRVLNSEMQTVITTYNGHAFAVLMGVHIMRLSETTHDWEWMTFFWSREENNQPGWLNPWRHYGMKSTSAIREDIQEDDPHRYCFNYYLEAAEQNGLKSNCASCHSFAAYSQEGSKLSDGTAYGLQYPYPADTRTVDELKYFDQKTVGTGLVWSIADGQDTGTKLALFHHRVSNFYQKYQKIDLK